MITSLSISVCSGVSLLVVDLHQFMYSILCQYYAQIECSELHVYQTLGFLWDVRIQQPPIYVSSAIKCDAGTAYVDLTHTTDATFSRYCLLVLHLIHNTCTTLFLDLNTTNHVYLTLFKSLQIHATNKITSKCFLNKNHQCLRMIGAGIHQPLIICSHSQLELFVNIIETY